jgi:hypothetical protein
MKYAFISPIEIIQNPDGTTGYRVAAVLEQTYEISKPYFWVSCTDDVVADLFWYDPTDQIIKPIPIGELRNATEVVY